MPIGWRGDLLVGSKPPRPSSRAAVRRGRVNLFSKNANVNDNSQTGEKFLQLEKLRNYNAAMFSLDTERWVAEVEDRAKALDLPLDELCRRAGIALSTFYHWKAGDNEPTLPLIRRIEAALDEGKPKPVPVTAHANR